jgi:hypothetical protein
MIYNYLIIFYISLYITYKKRKMNYDNEFIRSRVYVPLGTGAIAGVGTYAILGPSINKPYGMHPSGTIAISCAIASNVADMIKDDVLTQINGNEQASEFQSAILAPCLVGVGCVVMNSVLLRVPSMTGAMYMFGVGASSEVISQYLANNIIAPAV